MCRQKESYLLCLSLLQFLCPHSSFSFCPSSYRRLLSPRGGSGPAVTAKDAWIWRFCLQEIAFLHDSHAFHRRERGAGYGDSARREMSTAACPAITDRSASLGCLFQLTSSKTVLSTLRRWRRSSEALTSRQFQLVRRSAKES